MPIVRMLVAGTAAGVLSILTSWLVTGTLFHRFQALTPATWRPNEGSREYTASSAFNLVATLMLTFLFAATGGVHAWDLGSPLLNGLLFGVLAWIALALPLLLSQAVFVNVHRGVTTGLALDWLLLCLWTGAAAGIVVAGH